MPTQRQLDDALWEGVGHLKKRDKKVLDEIKARARGDLELGDWIFQGHWLLPLDEPKPIGVIARVHTRDLSVADFVSRFEGPNLPVLIDGLAEGWAAWQGAWEPRNLYAAYRDRRFRCGEDDQSRPVKLPLKLFLRYMRAQRDDSPLYIFDSMYNDKKTPSQLLQEYAVPPYFSEDLLGLVGEHRRPPYRWMLLGPKRSGTGVHIDPLGTSAWNTLLYGRKHWVLFDPGLSKEEVKGKDLVRKDLREDDEPIDYFRNILPRIKARWGKEATLGGRMLEFVQHPGETIFVPGGWWHAVINLDDTVAVTQNYCSSVNFDRVWAEARAGRRGMARKWLRVLRAHHPELAARADASNARVGWDSGALREAHRVRKAAKEAERAKARRERRERREKRKGGKGGAASGGGGIVKDSDDDTDTSSSDESSSESSGNTSSSSGSVTSLSSLSSAEQQRRRGGGGGGGEEAEAEEGGGKRRKGN
jgi:histone arginine demethylase JMJD6